MSKLRVLLLAVVSLSLASNTYASNCTNSTLLSYEADEALKLINEARTKVYNGEQKNGFTNTFLPATKNVTFLRWNCDLEQEAYTILSEECDPNYKSKNRANATYFRQNEKSNASLPRLIKFWISTLSHNELKVVNNSTVEYENKLDSLPFVNLIRYDTKEIGCSRYSCNPQYQVPNYKISCITNIPPLTNGDAIYEGNTEPNACPAKPYMSDAIRSAFLNKHNNLRTQLALGTVLNGNTGRTCRPAKNMTKLTYDCNLEKEAHDRARLCENFKREGTQTLRENSHNFTIRLNRTYEQAAQSITQLWWSELKASQGLNQIQNTFNTHLGINRFAKIASDLTTKVGCGMYDCGNMVNVVCRYKTTLEHAKRLYERGPSCRACGNKCTNGLCPAVESGTNV